MTLSFCLDLHWPRSAVINLIELWKENEANFSSANTRAKTVWQSIASSLNYNNFQPTWEQVENKWKGLRRTYKKIKDNNNSTGRAHQSWEFFDKMDEIFSRRPETNPISRASSSRGFIGQEEAQENISEDDDERPERRRRRTNRSDLFAEYIKDQRKRHKERIKAQNRLCDILDKIASNLSG